MPTSTSIHPYTFSLLSALLALSTSACADSIAPNGGEETGGPESEHVHSEAHESGGTFTRVDASDVAEWIYFDIDDAREVGADDPAWDMGFRRFEIKLNGGFSGDGRVEAAWVDGVDLLGAKVPEPHAFDTDHADEDADGVPDYRFVDWYDYDVETHTLSPAPRVWFVRSGAGETYALVMLDYYDAAGGSGHPSFAWVAREDAT